MLAKTLVVAVAFLSTSVLAAPIMASSLSLLDTLDFPTNCVMTAGSSQFATWIPTDGSTYATSALTCLNIQSSSEGSCNIANIDQIACINGYTCAWAGSNGWSGSQVGTASSGWVAVAPPQRILEVVAESNS